MSRSAIYLQVVSYFVSNAVTFMHFYVLPMCFFGPLYQLPLRLSGDMGCSEEAGVKVLGPVLPDAMCCLLLPLFKRRFLSLFPPWGHPALPICLAGNTKGMTQLLAVICICDMPTGAAFINRLRLKY